MTTTARKPKELLDQCPPHNLAMEREAISVLLCGHERGSGLLRNALDRGDFHDEQNAALFAAAVDAWDRSIPMNTKAGLLHAMRSTALGEAAAGPEHLNRSDAEAVMSCLAAGALPANASFYARTLRALRIRRELIRFAMTVIAVAYDEKHGVEALLASAKSMLTEIEGRMPETERASV